MPTSEELAATYGRVRSAVLTRHFALGTTGRANLVALDVTQPALRSQVPPGTEDVWARAQKARDNPLMFTGRLLTFLAAEHALGHPGSVPIIDQALDTVEELFPYAGDEPRRAGYLTRHDAATSNEWSGDGAYSWEFLIDPVSRDYRYCVPHRDPRHHAFRDPRTLDRLLPDPAQRAENDAHTDDYYGRYRTTEVSQDELVGLVSGYAIVHALVDVPATRERVARQAARVGNYLAENAYLLVRPEGGLCAQGSTGVLPGLEEPLADVFSRVAGGDFARRVGFAGGLDRAGYWPLLAGPVGREAALIAIGGPALAGAVAPVVAALLDGPLAGAAPLLATVLGAVADVASVAALPPSVRAALPFVLASVPTTLALRDHLDVLDLKPDERHEPLVSAALDLVPPPLRFDLVMDVLARLTGTTGENARGFLPYVGLCGVGDPGGRTAAAYLRAMRTHRETEAAAGMQTTERADLLYGAFASGVALLLGAPVQEEAGFTAVLAAHHARLAAAPGALTVGQWDDGRIYEDEDPGLDFLAGLALAWLYARRRADAGRAVATPDFPVPPPAGTVWSATVPAAAVAAHPEIAAMLGDPPAGVDVDVFDPAVPQQRVRPVAPTLPDPAAQTAVDTGTYTVSDRDGDVATDLVLEFGDSWEISAAGSLVAPEFLAGPSGPEGWNVLVDDARFPLHIGVDPAGARKYCLLGRIGTWFHVGAGRGREQYLYPDPRRLHLRVNIDDQRGGAGNGAFTVTVSRYRRPRPVVAVIEVDHLIELGPEAWLAQAWDRGDDAEVDRLVTGGAGDAGQLTVAGGAVEEAEVAALAGRLGAIAADAPVLWTSDQVADPAQAAAVADAVAVVTTRLGNPTPVVRRTVAFPAVDTPFRLFLHWRG